MQLSILYGLILVLLFNCIESSEAKKEKKNKDKDRTGKVENKVPVPSSSTAVPATNSYASVRVPKDPRSLKYFLRILDAACPDVLNPSFRFYNSDVESSSSSSSSEDEKVVKNKPETKPKIRRPVVNEPKPKDTGKKGKKNKNQ